MTRRTINRRNTQEKNLVDNRGSNSVDYQQGMKQPDKALPDNSSEGIKINADVWNEMITVGKLLCITHEDPTVYDLFDWMRINLFGGLPYGEGLLARVDAEILKELGPWEVTT